MSTKTFISTQLKNESLAINSYYQLGYYFFGPVLLEFIRRLIIQLSDDVQLLLFISREGYLLQQLYNLVTKKLYMKNVNNIYFLSSRRSITIPNIENEFDIKNILNYPYKGNYKDLMLNRFSILPNINLNNIELPNNNIVLKILKQFKEEILLNAQEEKNNYLKYISKLKIPKNLMLGLIDFGYSGTVQKYLQKLLPDNYIKGYYCITNNRNNNDAVGLLINHDNRRTTKEFIYKCNLLFEAILTSNNNQLLYFNINGNPIYSNNTIHDYNKIKLVHDGILSYAADNISNLFINEKVTNDLLNIWLHYIIAKNIISNEIIDIFEFKDEYCNLFNGNYYLTLINDN